MHSKVIPKNNGNLAVKFMISKKATKIYKIFTVDCKCQIDGEDFVNFSGLLRKHELYTNFLLTVKSYTQKCKWNVCEMK